MVDWNKKLQEAAAETVLEASSAVIRKDGSSEKPYCVYSERTGRKFGCYSSKELAEKRLKQIKMFKHIDEK